jgi:hypothetical protein
MTTLDKLLTSRREEARQVFPGGPNAARVALVREAPSLAAQLRGATAAEVRAALLAFADECVQKHAGTGGWPLFKPSRAYAACAAMALAAADDDAVLKISGCPPEGHRSRTSRVSPQLVEDLCGWVDVAWRDEPARPDDVLAGRTVLEVLQRLGGEVACAVIETPTAGGSLRMTSVTSTIARVHVVQLSQLGHDGDYRTLAATVMFPDSGIVRRWWQPQGRPSAHAKREVPIRDLGTYLSAAAAADGVLHADPAAGAAALLRRVCAALRVEHGGGAPERWLPISVAVRIPRGMLTQLLLTAGHTAPREASVTQLLACVGATRVCWLRLPFDGGRPTWVVIAHRREEGALAVREDGLACFAGPAEASPRRPRLRLGASGDRNALARELVEGGRATRDVAGRLTLAQLRRLSPVGGTVSMLDDGSALLVREDQPAEVVARGGEVRWPPRIVVGGVRLSLGRPSDSLPGNAG